jgi:parallel beta-helix repeat protein
MRIHSITLLAALLAASFCTLGNTKAQATEIRITEATQIQPALEKLEAGDTLILAPGDYYPAIAENPYNHLLMTGRSGRPDAWITIRGESGKEKPRIHVGGALPNGLAIRNGAYVRVDGLEIVGGLPADNGTNGIYIENMHHVQVVNCSVHDMGASGISLVAVSQVLIENNLAYGNCKKAAYGPSGISFYHAYMRSNDNSGFAGPLSNPNDQYAIIVRNNTCYDNIELVPDANYKQIIDGNGIIIDDFQGTQGNTTPFSGKTLVANNVCYNNGARGVHIFLSDNVDVFNNTIYKNQRNIFEAELTNYGNNNRYFNNIIYSTNRRGSFVGGAVNKNVIWGNNLYFNVIEHAQEPATSWDKTLISWRPALMEPLTFI